jgi:phosphohistidine phosphatase SixA
VLDTGDEYDFVDAALISTTSIHERQGQVALLFFCLPRGAAVVRCPFLIFALATTMRQPFRVLRQLSLALAVLLPCVAMAQPSMIYLVRHGEKAVGKDPELTAQGQLRAQNIATTLHRAGIQAIFSTPTTRTLQTAQPLAHRLNLPVQQYAANAPKVLVEKVKALRGAVLVVGHSNTLSELVTLFGGAPGAEIADEEYDRVYQLVNGADGKVTTVMLTSLPATPQ